MTKSKCKHDKLSHYEIIEASHGSHYDEDGEIWFNNEYGSIIGYTVTCDHCDQSWKVNRSAPQFIQDFHDKVQKDRIKKLES